MFGGGGWGTRLGSDLPKRGTNETRPPNARSGAVWGTVWGTRLEMLLVPASTLGREPMAHVRYPAEPC